MDTENAFDEKIKKGISLYFPQKLKTQMKKRAKNLNISESAYVRQLVASEIEMGGMGLNLPSKTETASLPLDFSEIKNRLSMLESGFKLLAERKR